MPSHPSESRPNGAASENAIRAGAAFIDFVVAVEQGDFPRAGSAATELRRLGYVVTLRPHQSRKGVAR